VPLKDVKGSGRVEIAGDGWRSMIDGAVRAVPSWTRSTRRKFMVGMTSALKFQVAKDRPRLSDKRCSL
jgi:hypothetical protein